MMTKFRFANYIATAVILFSYHFSQAQSNKYRFTYDLGAASGSYNEKSYSEINLGLNWHLHEYIIWRNAAFTRFNSKIDSIFGLDTSMRLTFDSKPYPGELGFAIFGGPGYRFATDSNPAAFVEGGGVIKFASMNFGAGIKSLYYSDSNRDPKNENIVFIILAGSGAF